MGREGVGSGEVGSGGGKERGGRGGESEVDTIHACRGKGWIGERGAGHALYKLIYNFLPQPYSTRTRTCTCTVTYCSSCCFATSLAIRGRQQRFIPSAVSQQAIT